MANFNLSTNMLLPVPTVGVDPGPDWATNLNSSLTLLDQHDHSSGKGVQITPAGLNITTDLQLLGNNLTLVRSVRLSVQGATLGTPTDLGCLYVVGADLYYNDEAGTVIRITQAGSVSGATGNIGGLVSPATATYVAAQQTFIFQSLANTSANLDGGSLILRNVVAGSKGLTLTPPAAMPANYAITLPTLPSVISFVRMDPAGNQSAAVVCDDVMITVASNKISLINNSITYSKLSNNAIMGSNVSVFNSSGTWLAPTNVLSVYVDMWGGGGGGGLAGANFPGAGGGSSGLRIRKMIPVTPGVTYTVTVGGAGAPSGAGGNSVIANGGTNLVQALGGPAGANPLASTGAGGLGGNAGAASWVAFTPGGNGGSATGANFGASNGYAGAASEEAAGGAGGPLGGGSNQNGGGGGGGAGHIAGANGGNGGNGGGPANGSGGLIANSGSGGGGAAPGGTQGGSGQAGQVSIFWAGPLLGE